MRKFMKLCLVLAALTALTATALAVPALAQDDDVPDLAGVWHISSLTMHKGQRGFIRYDNPDAHFDIVEQQEHLRGAKHWTDSAGVEHQENFSGVVAPDGELYFAEGEDGSMFGDLLDPERMTLYYLESGPNRTAMCLELERY